MSDNSNNTSSEISAETSEQTVKKEQKVSKNRGATEVKRVNNPEDTSLFIMNLFYCFFFRYVCRLKPIRDSDIYDCSESDRSAPVIDRVVKVWNPRIEKYYKELEDYNEKVKQGNKCAL